MRVRHAALVQALTGRFDEHHAELARILLGQYDALTIQIDALTTRIESLNAAIPAARGAGGGGTTGPGAGTGPGAAVLAAINRLDDIPGIGRHTAQVIIAEIGLDMSVFPTAGHLASRAKLSPRTIQSGPKNRSGKTGNPYLKGALGEVAAAAAKTDTFLGERYRRIVKRRGKLRALVAVARSILVIIWHLLADPAARYCDLGAGYHASRTDKTARPAATSASSKPSATPSPSLTPPDLYRPAQVLTGDHQPGSAAACLAEVAIFGQCLLAGVAGAGADAVRGVLVDGPGGDPALAAAGDRRGATRFRAGRQGRPYPQRGRADQTAGP
jgi:Transposase IS116/IS110/IS902 family